MTTKTIPATTGQHDSVDVDAYMRGFFAGHEQGNAVGAATEVIARQMQARAWGEGYDAGRADGTAATRADIGQAITDLAARYADIDESFAQFSRTTREQFIAKRVAAMERDATKLHAAIGTKPWGGLENGAVLPSADWDVAA